MAQLYLIGKVIAAKLPLSITFKNMMLKHYFLIGLLFLFSAQLPAAEKEEEKPAEATEETLEPEVEKPTLESEISTQIEKALTTGEAIWLGEEGANFLGLYKSNSFKETLGGILFLHDMGSNSDWPNLIKPLRLAFPKKGWDTLSIQLPMVNVDAEKTAYLSHFDEAVSRTNAGIEFLKQKGLTSIVILGHGMGSIVAIFDLNKNPQELVKGLIAMSLSGSDTIKPPLKETPPSEKLTAPAATKEPSKEKKEEKKEEAPEPAMTEEPAAEIPERDLFAEMAKIKIPFLDIYAQQDHQDVVREAEKRSESMEGNNQSYFQWEIEGADHYYRGLEKQLLKRLRGWLKKQIVEKKPPVSPNP
ncbi:MAG: DUF3530 family protein [Gammaproteobacteria bacterium]